MKCPRDGNDLAVEIRHEVEIDVCPACHGIWLDHEELAKIMNVVQANQHDEPRNSVLDNLPSSNRSSSQPQQPAEEVAPDVTSTDGGGIGDFFSDLFDGL